MVPVCPIGSSAEQFGLPRGREPLLNGLEHREHRGVGALLCSRVLSAFSDARDAKSRRGKSMFKWLRRLVSRLAPPNVILTMFLMKGRLRIALLALSITIVSSNSNFISSSVADESVQQFFYKRNIEAKTTEDMTNFFLCAGLIQGISDMMVINGFIILHSHDNDSMLFRVSICPIEPYPAGWIPTRSATPSTALVPQRKVGFPILNACLLLGFGGDKDGSARRNIEPLQ